jgi:hypothetical protein
MDNIKLIIHYFSLKNYIIEQGFSAKEAQYTIGRIRKMDKQIKKSFILWFNKGILPKYSIENITFNELIEELKMNEINAFLFINWLNKEPEAAKKAILRLRCEVKGNVNDEITDEIKKNLNPEAPECEDDIVELDTE